MITTTIILALSASTSLLATPAPRSARLFTPVAQHEAGLSVVRERVAVDCRGLPKGSCSVTITQALRCGAQACSTPLILPGGMRVAIRDGGGTLQRRQLRVELALPAGSDTTLEVRGEIDQEVLRRPDSGVLRAVQARHIIMSNYAPPTQARLSISGAARRLRALSYELALVLHFPEGWELATTIRDRYVHPEASVEAAFSAPPGVIYVNARPRAQQGDRVGPWAGGMILGFGQRIERQEFSFRVGYEFAAPAWLLYSINVETNFHDDVVVAPHIVGSLPTLASLPVSFAAGIGIPVRVTGEPEVGARIIATMQVLVVAIGVTLDLYPGRRSGILETTVSGLVLF